MAGGRIIGRVSVKVTPDTTEFRRRLKRDLDRIEAATKPIKVNVDVEADTGGVVGDTRRVAQEAEKAGKINLKADLDKSSTDRISKALSVLGTVAKGIALGAAAGGLIGGLAGIAAVAVQAVAALAPLIGAVGVALPAALVTAAVGFGALKVGFSGFGDALKNLGDTEKFNEALKKLSPNAQALAKALKELHPSFAALKTAVQDRLFEGLAEPISRLVKLSLPSLQAAFVQVASGVNKAIAQIAVSFASLENQAKLSTLFASSAGTVTGLTAALPALSQAFLDLAAAAAPLVRVLSANLGQSLIGLSESVSQFAADGGVARIFSGASQAADSIGQAFSDLKGIVTGIFTAMETAGTSAFGAIGNALSLLNDGINSVVGQTFLVTFFTQLQAVAQALGPVLQAAFTALAPLLEVVGQLATALGPGVAALLTGLAGGFQALTPAAKPVGDALSAVLEAAAPLLPLLGQLVTAVLLPLAAVVAECARVMKPFWEQFAAAVGPMIPQLASALMDLADAILPIIPPLGQLAVALLPLFLNSLKSAIIVIQVAAPIIKLLATAFGAVISVAAAVIGFFTRLGAAITGIDFGAVLAGIGAFFSAIGGFLASVGSAVLGFFTSLPGKILSALVALPGLLFKLFLAIPGLILQALITLPGMLISFIGTVIATIITVVGTGLVLWLSFWISLPGRIIAAIAALPGLLVSFFSMVFGFVASIVAAGFNAVVGFFQALPGRAISALAALGGLLSGLFTRAVSGAKNAVTAGFNAVVSFVSGIPGKITGALGDVANLLKRAGEQIIEGLARGIRAAAQKVVDAVKGVLDKAAGLLPGSPVKEGPLRVLNRGYAGRKIVEMVADGITANLNTAVAASTALAGKVANGIAPSNFSESGGAFVGTLTLDSGEFLGKVRGEVKKSQSRLARDLAVGRT